MNRTRASLAELEVGNGIPVRIIGAINVSPESFYKGSVKTEDNEIVDQARLMIKQGADVIDLGAMSTAPYLKTIISEELEVERMTSAIHVLIDGGIRVPISADTKRANVANAALEAGAVIINDVTGLTDEMMADVIAKFGASLIVGAASPSNGSTDPIGTVYSNLETSLERAFSSGIQPNKIVADPTIGFIRDCGLKWYEWDCMIINSLSRLQSLDRPICIGVSRKSFIGELLKAKPEERLIGSITATAIAIYNGANVIRTHDVHETLQAIRIVEGIKKK